MGDGTQLPWAQAGDRHRFSVQRYEFHLVALAAVVDMDHRADVACSEVFFRQVGGQHYAPQTLAKRTTERYFR